MTTFRPFPLLILRITIRARQRLVMKHFPGAQLRGNFDDALRKQECLTGDCNCSGCRYRPACAYASLFNPAFDNLPDSGKTSEYPRPYILCPTTVPSGGIRKGEIYTFDLTLIGTATQHATAVIKALIAGGEAGIGSSRGKYELESVHSVNDDRAYRIYHHGTLAMMSPPYQAWMCNADAPPCHEISIRLMTPLSLRSEEKFIGEPPSFAIFFQFLVTRICRLSAYMPQPEQEQVGGCCPYGVTSQNCTDAQSCYDLKVAAEEIQLIAAELNQQEILRHSARTYHTWSMKGQEGQLFYQGDLTKFLPLLQLGEKIHIGKMITNGLGKYKLDW